MTSLLYIEGRLVGKPLVQKTKSGYDFAKILLEEDQVARNNREKANVLPIAFFGKLVEEIRDLENGDGLLIACRLQGSRYETDSGEVRYGLQLIGERAYLNASAAKETIR
jgi:single-stranded DNA-binding protein